MQLDLDESFHENGRNQWSGQMLALNQLISLGPIIYIFAGTTSHCTFQSKPGELVVDVKPGFTQITEAFT